MNKYVVTMVVLAAFSVQLNAADWTQFRGPNSAGISSESGLNFDGLARAKAVWTTPMTNGFSSITTNGDTVYTLISDGGNEHCIAVNAATGEQLWKSVALGSSDYGNGGGNAGARGNNGGDGPRSTPTISNGKVYALTAELILSCLDASTGKVAWQRNLVQKNGGRLPKWKNAASPIIEGDSIFVNCGSAKGAFLAINKNNGEVIWSVGSDEMTHSSPVLATIHNVRQVIFFAKSGLVSCDVNSGKVLWKQAFKFNVSTAMSPIVDGDVVYCSAGYGVGSGAFRVSPSGNGFNVENLWFKVGNTLANHWSTPIVKDGHLFGLFGFKKYAECPLMCVNIRTGEVKWEKKGFGPGGVTLSGDTLVVLGDEGQLVAVKATTAGYQEVGRVDLLDGKAWGTPTISNGRVFARTTKEGLCLKLGN